MKPSEFQRPSSSWWSRSHVSPRSIASAAAGSVLANVLRGDAVRPIAITATGDRADFGFGSFVSCAVAPGLSASIVAANASTQRRREEGVMGVATIPSRSDVVADGLIDRERSQAMPAVGFLRRGGVDRAFGAFLPPLVAGSRAADDGGCFSGVPRGGLLSYPPEDP